MSRSDVRRPETARPRSDRPTEAQVEPADADELAAMERGLVRLAELLGATASPEPELGLTLVRWRGRGPAFNQGTLVRWPDTGWEPMLARLEERLVADGTIPVLVVAEGRTTPVDLPGHLKRLGWVSLLSETVLWTRRAASVPHLDPGMRIEAVTERSVAEYETVERAVFGLPPTESEERAAALRRSLVAGTQRAFLVRVGDQPIATARLVPGEGVAAIHGVGVVEPYRRQGYGRLITTVATRAALATGHRLIWLSVASDNEAARTMYERLDYRPAFGWSLLARP